MLRSSMGLGGRLGWKAPRRLAAGLSLLALLAAPAAGAEVASEGKVNVNTASVEELTSLPGIGPSRAKAIVERRGEKPFASVDELRDVAGIGDSVMEKLKDRVVASTAGSGGDPAKAAGSASGAGRK